MKRLFLLFAALFPATAALAAPPANDDYAAFTSLGAVLPVNVPGTNVEATVQAGELLEGSMTTTVWYRWTAPATGLVEINLTGADFDTMLAVYTVTGGLPGPGDRLAFNDDAGGGLTSRVILEVSAGQEIAIQVGGYDGATGSFPLALTGFTTSHDNYAERRNLGSGVQASAGVSNTGATLEAGEFTANPSVEATLWFTWTAPYTGSCTADTVSGNVIDTFLVAYTDNGVLPAAPQEIARSNDAAGGVGSEVTFGVTAGQTYAFQAGGMGAARGPFTFRVTLTVPPPGNDNYMNPLGIGGALPLTVTGVNVGASLEPFENAGIPETQATVWYTWTAPDTDRYQFDTLTGTTFDTTLTVFTGSGGPVPPGGESMVGANDDASPAVVGSQVIISATAGQTYAIQVGGLRASRGEFTLTVSLALPPNDDYAGRIALFNTASLTTSGWNNRATLEPGETVPAPLMQGTVWYTWTAPASGSCVVDTLDPLNPDPLDTILAVYADNGALPEAGALLASNDDYDGGLASRLAFNAVAGQTYVIQVGGYDEARGDFPLHLDLTVLPPDIAITSPPDDLDPAEGVAAMYALEGVPLPFTFTIANTGGGSLTGISAVISGDHAAEFVLTTPPPDTLTDFQQAAFTVTFTPALLGELRTATLTLTSSDPDESPIVITLQSFALSFTTDFDGDGLSDASEYQLRALGFNLDVAQPALVAALRAGASGAGLYTKEQLQGLHAGASFAGRDPATGRFTLKLSLTKSADLENYTPFPFTPADTSVDAEGNIRFDFDAPADAAFFKLGVE